MSDPYRYDDEEDEEEPLPFFGVDKASALQQCRVFNEVPLNVNRSVRAMTQVLYTMSTGTTFTPDEATELFFMSTKLLQSAHPKLRRLHYVLMKELSPLVEQSFIASNSLMNDIKGGSDTTKMNAVRTLYAVMDSSMYNSIARTIAECMTAHNPSVVNAALITAVHIAQENNALARGWQNQLNEVMKSQKKAQYATIALLQQLSRNDRLNVTRLTEMAANRQIGSPLAICLIIKLCGRLLQADFTESLPLYKFVCFALNHASDLVVFEASKVICSLRNITDKEVTPAVISLQSQLVTQSPVMRFSAIFLLSQLATTHPAAVSPINNEIEALVADTNRTISTLAVTCLLKTGTEASIERLVTQMSAGGYLEELEDEFKTVIVDSMRVLSVKFPAKRSVFLAFLYEAIGGEGGSELKEHIVDVMLGIARQSTEMRDLVLMHLAEFIDDCVYVPLKIRVLMYIGEEAPNAADPKRYVRYVYNHAVLEEPEVRVVAISTLAKMAARLPAQRRSLVALLRRACMDTDDEVRDRAVFFTRLFLSGDEAQIQAMVTDVAAAVVAQRQLRQSARDAAAAQSKHSRAPDMDADADVALAAPVTSSSGPSYAITPAVLKARDDMRHIQQLRDLGEPLHSAERIALTEPDSEFVVSVMKHVFASHLVLQFRVKNTMEEMHFCNVTVDTNTEELEAEPLYAIPIDVVAPGATRCAYVVLRYEPGNYPMGAVTSSFKFAMKESEDDAPGDEDEYPLEDFELGMPDYITPVSLGSSSASKAKWEAEAGNETAGTFALQSMRNLTTATHELAAFFGMHVEGGVPERVSETSHTLFMTGTMADEAHTLVMVQAKVFIASNNSVALQLALRGGTEELREYLANALLA